MVAVATRFQAAGPSHGPAASFCGLTAAGQGVAGVGITEGRDGPSTQTWTEYKYNEWAWDYLGDWTLFEVDIRDLFPSVPLEKLDDTDGRRIWLDPPGDGGLRAETE